MGEVGARNTMNILESSLGALEDALNQITEVSEGGSGDFLLGDSFSLAECIAAPWVQRLFVTLPYFRSVDFRKTVLPYKRTKKWMDAVRARSSVTVTKCPEDEIVAAARRYYVSYISPGSPGAME
uniref:GST C-terminal domain-containing protein n=1 Tax=Pseudictyota dubia TaxID=2749911 RepID=A0A7R9ZG78_9STRA|mmetsp:Transcript_597/g.814  ORF Transcript_597/g.814 Transcript_597/m.814 type:complete len:125 (+) Transcript_597:524-898(+)